MFGCSRTALLWLPSLKLHFMRAYNNLFHRRYNSLSLGINEDQCVYILRFFIKRSCVFSGFSKKINCCNESIQFHVKLILLGPILYLVTSLKRVSNSILQTSDA